MLYVQSPFPIGNILDMFWGIEIKQKVALKILSLRFKLTPIMELTFRNVFIYYFAYRTVYILKC